MRFFIILISILCLSFRAKAEFSWKSYFDELETNIINTWNSYQYDFYVPLYAWHNRLTYDDEHIDKYNENPWGAGFGKTYYDREGNWHGLYAMAFKDSNDYVETFFGYAFQKNWEIGNNSDLRAGIGYTLGITQRHEYSYIPIPIPLPIAGIEYKRIALQAAYVPGLENDGNVLFTWLRLGF